MVEDGRRPGTANVAVITLVVGLNVFCRFAVGDAAVMTLETIIADLGMVGAVYGRPGIYIVASVACVAGNDMPGVFASGIDTGTGAVAAAALARRPLEFTPGMTSGAIDSSMSTRERKGGQRMIETLA